MIVKVLLDDGAEMPYKAHESDAGFDLVSMDTKLLQPGEHYLFGTGVHLGMHRAIGYADVRPRSSMSKKALDVKIGLVDCGYTGEVMVNIQNNDSVPHQINKGDRIAQLLFPVDPFCDLVRVYNMNYLGFTDRGNKGFGSSGV